MRRSPNLSNTHTSIITHCDKKRNNSNNNSNWLNLESLFDNGLFDYRLTSIEIIPWNANDNKTNQNQSLHTRHFELFALTLCNFSKYLVKLTFSHSIHHIFGHYVFFKLCIISNWFNTAKVAKPKFGHIFGSFEIKA